MKDHREESEVAEKQLVITTRLPRSMRKRLRLMAADLEVSMQSIILEALASWMDDHTDAV